MFQRHSSERTLIRVVKASMSRVMIICVAVVSALRMLTGQCALETQSGFASPGSLQSTFAFDNANVGRSSSPFSADISARVAHSRIGKIPGKITPLPSDPLCRLHSVPATTALAALRLPRPALASCWQFACRAAPEPRAPASVS
jgi:hypothetical protein